MRTYRLAISDGGKVKATRDFESKDKRDQFVQDLRHGRQINVATKISKSGPPPEAPDQFSPLDCGPISLNDDFRPFAKKKLVCIYQSDTTDYFELMP